MWLTFCFVLLCVTLAVNGGLWVALAIGAVLAVLYVVTLQRFHSYRDHGWISVGPEHLATRSFGGRIRVITLAASGSYALYTGSMLGRRGRSMGPRLIIMGPMKRRLLVSPSKRRKRVFRMPTSFYLRDDVQRVAEALPVPVQTFDALDDAQMAREAPGSVTWTWRHPAVSGLLTGVGLLLVASVFVALFGSSH